MARLTNISMVIYDSNNQEYTVYYKSGLKRSYKASNAPKSVVTYFMENADIAEGLERDDEYDDPFFKSEDAKAIFYLVMVDGETRMDGLKITRLHYASVEKANQWKKKYDDILKGSTHPMADKARAEVERIYNDMLPREPEVTNITEDVMDDADTFNPVNEWLELNEENPGTTFANEQLWGYLNDFYTVESLHKIVRNNHMDPANRTRRWDKKRLIDFIVKMAESRATMGDVFFNYKG